MSLKRTGFLAKFPPRPAREWTGADPRPRTPAVVLVLDALRRIVSVPKENAIEHEGYRRLVAALPCVRCGVVGYSQCAHPNTGKAKGRKADDRLTFPLCCSRLLVAGCHVLFDQHQLFARAHRRGAEESWGHQTRTAILNAGAWPANLPRWKE